MATAFNRVKSTNDLELTDRLVDINRVTKVTKGGRTFTFAAIVVVGNQDGVIGVGLGKAGEVSTALAKGVEAAKKNLIRVPVIRELFLMSRKRPSEVLVSLFVLHLKVPE